VLLFQFFKQNILLLSQLFIQVPRSLLQLEASRLLLCRLQISNNPPSVLRTLLLHSQANHSL